MVKATQKRTFTFSQPKPKGNALKPNNTRLPRAFLSLLATLAMLLGLGLTSVTVATSARASDADTYSWSDATTLNASTDDYGYATCPSNDTGCKTKTYVKNGVTYGEYDPWNYNLRNCTSYVAEKISQEFNGRNVAGWGNAADWATSAQKAGYGLDTAPRVGDIAQWGTEKGGGFGHAAYVYAVNNGVASLDEYNVANTGVFTSNRTTAANSAGAPDHYIHIGDVSSGGGSGSSGGGAGVGNGTYFGSDTLTSGQTLAAGQYLESKDAQYILYMQGDGNLVLYGGQYQAKWASNTGGHSGAKLIMQTDGNLVIYSGGTAIWSSGSNGVGNLVIQDDGNAVIYHSGSPIWSVGNGAGVVFTYFGSDTLAAGNILPRGSYLRSADKRYVLLMQPDGNLVLYGPGGHVLWATGTNGHSGAHLAMQTDGDVVVYSGSTPIWSADSWSAAGNLVIQSDGNAVVYVNGAFVWSTGTSGQV